MTPKQLTGQTDTHLESVMVGKKAFLVHPLVSQDLLALKQAADDAGFNFNITSGFRDFERQLDIWNRKMSGQAEVLGDDSTPLNLDSLTEEQKVFAILRWSALPGGSRHHWGTDFDVFDRSALPTGMTLKLEQWEYLTGHQAHFYQWLAVHLAEFGFFFPYQQDKGGVACEPWHISHRTTAQVCLEQLTCEQLAKQLDQTPLLGKQAVQAHLTQVYNQYITNISQPEF
ncbi:M15 family metallopeptidase [Vibrio aestuarianus]|uniref:M15 family metallopeptidase n=1 Tax=Vibrio aestuarianus TaxID=28171 RepID=UPI00237C76C9|nr:M15 family metallopeptidase [Vibrio aestuarianus]MDE1230538.1 M15 family metallopeptidase [Vibrio aestuarianus]MDE1334519.1 M15 family metallopeptidase [Vibrio aestuarianus]